jgi:hypothetical protein
MVATKVCKHVAIYEQASWSGKERAWDGLQKTDERGQEASREKGCGGVQSEGKVAVSVPWRKQQL